MVGNGDTVNACEEAKLKEIAKTMYPDDHDRAQILIEVVHEYYDKITENNNLVYDNLIRSIVEDIKLTPRFSKKIDVALFSTLKECIEDDEERIFHERIMTFLNDLREEYGEL
jgi:molybdopterin converting factor small subunit